MWGCRRQRPTAESRKKRKSSGGASTARCPRWLTALPGGSRQETSKAAEAGRGKARCEQRRSCKSHLGLGRSSVIIAVGSGAQGSAEPICADSTAFGQVLLSLCLPNLDLLFLAATPQFFGLERVLGLELGPPVLGDVPVSHDCGRRLRVSAQRASLRQRAEQRSVRKRGRS